MRKTNQSKYFDKSIKLSIRSVPKTGNLVAYYERSTKQKMEHFI